jgi:enterochelin esterase family protein
MKNIFSVLLISLSIAQAQPNFGPRNPGDTLQSVRISGDRSVVLSIYAPKASEVTVTGDFRQDNRPLSLSKGADGVWSVMIKDLRPDIYSYDFRVDGIQTYDQRNSDLIEMENNLSNIFEVPGPEGDYCAIKPVPHGNVIKNWMHSNTLKKTIRFHVYTPPGYEKMREKLPVLYLQHGGGANDATWLTIGRANFILDNLLAEGRIKPFVVVMPMGHPTPGMHFDLGLGGDKYYQILFNEIMPYVETNYNVSDKRYDKAYSGLSMGGLQALNIALFAPEKFGYVLPLSTGYFPPQVKELEEKHATALQNPEINKLKLFWIAMGGETDIAYQNGNNVNAVFDKYGIKYTKATYPAGHTYITWRHNLHTFAPLLFK